ncbi:hypothetical protein R1flu_025260 [Riccia fluitans]|uniref:Uncharacterized protein n=1 Tax=Riccia fluitans TaxID=41844 RepID=A0ABD1XX90_9MARC
MAYDLNNVSFQDSGKSCKMGVVTAGGVLDNCIRDSIFHAFGFCTHEEELKKRLAKAEESKHDLMVHLQQTQRSLRDCERKLNQSKEETMLNASALKRQIAENQKLREQCVALEDECTRLEHDRDLYHNDREVFMEAAYEAEDRAADAEDRAVEAETRSASLQAELQQLRQSLSHINRDRRACIEAELLQMRFSLSEINRDNESRNSEDDVASLRSRIADLEGINASLQEELSQFRSAKSLEMTSGIAKQYEETKRQLRCLQDTYATEKVATMAEQVAQVLVTSVVIAKALDRAQVAEKNLETCTDNLRKAEDEVTKLADDRRVLIHLADENNLLPRILRKTADEQSPKPNKGISENGSSKSRGRVRSKPCECEDSYCEMCKGRQPLMPLQANSVDRKAIRRQYPAVENFLHSLSSPSRGDSSSKFEDL